MKKNKTLSLPIYQKAKAIHWPDDRPIQITSVFSVKSIRLIPSVIKHDAITIKHLYPEGAN